jgi:phosphate transport system substrate-binding protein
MAPRLADAEDRAGARHHLVARDAVGIIVHPSVPLADLRRDQVRALLSGEVANWRTLHGPDLAVSVLALPRGATARQSAESLVLDGDEFAVDARECASAAALAAAVAATPGAIACLDGRDRRGLDRDGAAALAVLAVDGVAPTLASVLSGRYPYTEGFHLLLYGAVHAPDDNSAAFVRFARSAAGQAIVERLGFVAVC